MATGGVICHKTNLRLPLDAAVDCDVIDEDLLIKLEYNDKPARTYADPNTEETLPYKVSLIKTKIAKKIFGS